MVEGKGGWIRIVEAFVAILIIAGALLVVIDRQASDNSGIEQEVYEQQIAILRAIELDGASREGILNIPGEDIPLSSNQPGFPAAVTGQLATRIPENLECSAKICALEKVCVMDEYLEKNVYAASVAIAANDETYAPKQLKLFCWLK